MRSEHRLVLDFNTIIRAKIYFFLKKSVWRYIILTGIMGIILPMYGTHPVVSAAIYFLIVMLILWPLQFYSAKTMQKQFHFDALVTFTQEEIIIKYTNKDLVETKNWNWVKQIDLKKDSIWLILNEARPFAINIPKAKLQQSEIDFFIAKETSRYKKG
ncbi:hypothetical protein FNB79_11560 [Formosa sediminum]|uniref:YcxB family protein n=1 Tax=Formosa sediminum TaxID=2594004 RepID=A0A516GST3_9FLAO|nr:hypothetical protein [Formosa sediminum]QDO94574.1 hypothetical protein FNB79_11560 [Formosa sediminum]